MSIAFVGPNLIWIPPPPKATAKIRTWIPNNQGGFKYFLKKFRSR